MADAAVDRFVKHVADACARRGVTFDMRRGRRVDSGDGVLCHGFFEEGTKRLVVAAGGPPASWLPVLVHEYGHMRQWMAGSKLWAAASDEAFIRWLAGERIGGTEAVTAAYRRARDMELDCERRALRLIAAHGLPVDPQRYARMANAYIAFYAVARQCCAWYTSGPWEVREVLALCPSRLMPRSWFERMPRPLADAIIAHCIPSRARRAAGL